MAKMKEKRNNLFLIPDSEVTVDDQLNGRWKPVSQQAIEDMAHSILENGQLQPVEVRTDRATGKYKTILGVTRVKAIKWGNETGLFNPPLLIKAIKTTANDEVSFKHNLVENLERNNTTAIDDAHNHQRLREQYGWSDVEIAKLYKYSPQKVSQYKHLLELPTKIQEQIHDGVMSVAAGVMVAMSGMPEKEIPELVKSCVTDAGKVDTTVLKNTLRNFSIDESDLPEEEEDEELIVDEEESDTEGEDLLADPSPKKTPPKKTTYSRSLKEIKEYWEGQTGLVDPSPALGKFAKSLVKYLKGEIKEETMTKAFDRLYDEISTEIKEGGE